MKEIWTEVANFIKLEYYKMPHFLKIIWLVLVCSFLVIVVLSMMSVFYRLINSSIKAVKKINKDLIFLKFTKKSNELYKKNIPKLNLISKKDKNIGGINVLTQTNWQFQKKKGKQFIIREPEELGFREVIDEDTLVKLALAKSIEITKLNLCTDEMGWYVNMTLRNVTERDIICKIPKGQVFENKDIKSKSQNLASDQEYSFNLAVSDKDKKLRIRALCLNQDMSNPDGAKGAVTIFEVTCKDFNGRDELWSLIETQNMLFEPVGFTKDSKPDLTKSIVFACHILQGIKKSVNKDENSRTVQISRILNEKGFKAKDQSLWGSSETGKRMGEIDIKIDDEHNNTISLCEAFCLENNDTTKIASHLKKIFSYDVNGLEKNYIIIYAESKNFNELWQKYLLTAKNIDYPYILKNEITDLSDKLSRFADIEIGLGSHQRNDSIVGLYHIFVNMN